MDAVRVDGVTCGCQKETCESKERVAHESIYHATTCRRLRWRRVNINALSEDWLSERPHGSNQIAWDWGSKFTLCFAPETSNSKFSSNMCPAHYHTTKTMVFPPSTTRRGFPSFLAISGLVQPPAHPTTSEETTTGLGETSTHTQPVIPPICQKPTRCAVKVSPSCRRGHMENRCPRAGQVSHWWSR